jgi:hypothetical protein
VSFCWSRMKIKLAPKYLFQLCNALNHVYIFVAGDTLVNAHLNSGYVESAEVVRVVL